MLGFALPTRNWSGTGAPGLVNKMLTFVDNARAATPAVAAHAAQRRTAAGSL
jgi:hypothetical protein